MGQIERGYSEAEAAAILTDLGYPLSPRTLARLRASGQIGYTRLSPRRVRYRMSDLEAYITRGHPVTCLSPAVPSQISRSAATGYAADPAAGHGASGGGTAPLAPAIAAALASRI